MRAKHHASDLELGDVGTKLERIEYFRNDLVLHFFINVPLGDQFLAVSSINWLCLTIYVHVENDIKEFLIVDREVTCARRVCSYAQETNCGQEVLRANRVDCVFIPM